MNTFSIQTPSRAETNSWSMGDILTPQFMVTMTSLASARNLESLRNKYKEQKGISPSYTAIILKAVAVTLKKNPNLNRAIIGPPFFRKVVTFQTFNINVAVEKNLPNIPGQAYAPTIQNVENKSLLEITENLKFYANCDEKTDKNYALFMNILKYAPWPLSKWILNLPCWSASLWLKHRGAACWVNSPSKSGADLVFTTWPWPVTFSFGIVKKRAFVVNEEIVAEPTIPLVMVFDRRLMGGGPAGRIFSDFKQIIENADLEFFEK